MSETNEKIINIECEKEVINRIINKAKPFTAEIALNIKKDAIDTTVVDNSHVLLYKGIINKKHFTKYIITKDTQIGIDIDKINLPLTITEKTLKITWDGIGRLHINNYKMGLIDMTGIPEPKMPELHPPIEIKIEDTPKLKRILNAGSKLRDYFTLICEKDKQCYIKIEGDTDEFTEPIGKAKELLKTEYPVVALYSIDFMTNALKELTNTILLRYNSNNPIEIIEENDEEKHIFLIAPRIQNE
jgi:hypothetical protein